MRGLVRSVAGAALGVVALIGMSGCGSSHSAVTSISPTVGVDSTSFPQLHTTALVDQQGYALYVFAPDERRAVTCTGTCLLTWPPLTVGAGQRPEVGAGVDAKLIGYDSMKGGQRVVTYDGWPLYTYTGDVQPGAASGQAIDLNGGLWYLISPDGHPITAPLSDTGASDGSGS